MMGAGGFIRNPGWEILSSDDLMDEDYDNGVVVEAFYTDEDEIDLSRVVLLLPPTDEEIDEDDDFSDIDNDDDDDDYVPSDSLDDEDFDDDNAIIMSSEEGTPELGN